MDPEQQFRLLAVAALVDGRFAPEERAVLLQHSRALGLELPHAERVIREVAGGTSPAASAPSCGETLGRPPSVGVERVFTR